MRKKSIVAVCFFIVILFSGCGLKEKVEEMNKGEALIVEQYLFGIPDAKVRNLVFDDESIKEVNKIFAQIDWRERAEEDRPIPQYQIGNYEIWILDESPIVHAVNLIENKSAELNEEDSELIIKFIIGVFH